MGDLKNKKMKKNSKSIRIIRGTVLLPIFLILFSLSSCLKNGQYNIDFSTVGASVDLPLAAANSNGVVTFAYNPSVTSVQLPFYIDLASPQVFGTAVTATMALDTAFLSSYNAANGTSYALMPDSVYTIINGFARTIPAGKRLDSMYVNFDFTKMDLSQSYVLPVTIQSASVPIEQWNHLMINPSVKNIYDGVYNLTGTTLRAGDPTLSGTITPTTMNLITSGAASVTFGALQPWANGGGGVSIGSPMLTVNSDNSVTIASSGGATNYPAYSSTYDPNAQAFYISFTWGAGPTMRLATDTLVYSGPR
jgi:hypothetical protein